MTKCVRVPLLSMWIMVCLAAALPARAQNCEGCEVQYAEVSDPCPDYDACTMYEKAYYSNGTYIYVPMSCKKTWCRTCDSRNRCVSVNLDANCSCDDEAVQGAGPNITQCSNMWGTCVAN